MIGVWNNDITHTRQSDPLYRAFDLTIGRVAASAGARFADPFPLFNPQGSLAREKARICAYTFICSRGDGRTPHRHRIPGDRDKRPQGVPVRATLSVSLSDP